MCPFLKSLPQIQDGSTPDSNPSASTPPPQSKTPTSTYSGPIICYCCGEASHSSVGEVQSSPVPGHCCQMGDLTVPSLTQFLGLGLGPPWTIISVWSQSRPRPDGPCTFYLFIYSRSRTVGSCATAQHPTAISEPGAQCRTALSDPGPPHGPSS